MIVAVKPYLVKEVLEPVRDLLKEKAIVSVAAGLLFEQYEEILGTGYHHLSTQRSEEHTSRDYDQRCGRTGTERLPRCSDRRHRRSHEEVKTFAQRVNSNVKTILSPMRLWMLLS